MKTKTKVKAGTKFFNEGMKLKLNSLNTVQLNRKLETIVKHKMNDLFRIKLNIPVWK